MRNCITQLNCIKKKERKLNIAIINYFVFMLVNTLQQFLTLIARKKSFITVKTKSIHKPHKSLAFSRLTKYGRKFEIVITCSL